MDKTLYIVRGLPGSGKSTLGEKLADHAVAADDYMVNENNVYSFDPSRLKECHDKCFNYVKHVMENKKGDSIAVCNTFSQEWEYMRYVFLAVMHGYDVIGLDVSGLHGNVHGAPKDAILKMDARFNHGINNAIALAKTIFEGIPYGDALASDEWFQDWLHRQH